MKFYRRISDQLERVTFWGIFDHRNWRNYWPVEGRVDYAGLIDRKGEKKPAFHAVLDPDGYLKQFDCVEIPLSPIQMD